MKRLNQMYFFLLLLTPALLVPFSHADANCSKDKEQSHCDTHVTVIFQKDVGPNGYPVIDHPGRFCLGENIVWAPTTGGDETNPKAAFLIASHNVEFDLNSYTFSQQLDLDGLPKVGFTTGIRVVPGCEFVTIKNGQMIDISTFAIIAGGQEGSVQNLTLENLVIKFCGRKSHYFPYDFGPSSGAIAVVGPDDNRDSQCHTISLQNSTLNFNGPSNEANTFVDSLFLVGSQGVDIQNCDFSNNISNNAVCTGLFISDAQDVHVTNCTGNNNRGVLEAAGIHIAFTTDTTIENCQASGQIIEGATTDVAFYAAGQANGFSLEVNNNLRVINCTANNQRASLVNPNLVVRANGFAAFNTINATFENCIASSNVCTVEGSINEPASSQGFLLGCTESIFNECVASSNTNCGSANITSRGFQAIPYSDHPFRDPIVNSNNVFDGCIAQNNGCSSPDVCGAPVERQATYVAITNEMLKNKMQKKPKSREETFDNTISPGAGSGFAFQNQESCSIVNCLSASNNGDGFLLNCESQGNFVEHNIANNNQNCGINDETTQHKKNVYLSNKGFQNSVKNFCGKIKESKGVPIVKWDYSGNQQPEVATVLDNIDIH